MDSGACAADLCKDTTGDHVPDAKATYGLVPVTPDAVRENGDIQSPLTLTLVRKQLNLATIHSESEHNVGAPVDTHSGSPRTPKDGVFDPFAPGHDDMARAPHCNKYLDDFRTCVARRLNFHPFFDLVHDADSLSDEDVFESVYENLLQVIVSNQTEGILAQLSDDSDDCKTPPSLPRLTGISDTCPGAPVKPTAKPRNIQVGLCKKLEF